MLTEITPKIVQIHDLINNEKSAKDIQIKPTSTGELEVTLCQIKVGTFSDFELAVKYLNEVKTLPLKPQRDTALSLMSKEGEESTFVMPYTAISTDSKVKLWALYKEQLKDIHLDLVLPSQELVKLLTQVSPVCNANLINTIVKVVNGGYTSIHLTQTPSAKFNDLSSIFGDHPPYFTDNDNENCLTGYECPSCGKSNRFNIETNCMIPWTDDGSEDGIDHDFIDDGNFECCHCHFSAKRKCFQTSKEVDFIDLLNELPKNKMSLPFTKDDVNYELILTTRGQKEVSWGALSEFFRKAINQWIEKDKQGFCFASLSKIDGFHDIFDCSVNFPLFSLELASFGIELERINNLDKVGSLKI